MIRIRRCLAFVFVALLLAPLVLAWAQDSGQPTSDFPSPTDHRLYSPGDIRARCIEFTGISQGTNPEDYRECAVSKSGGMGEIDGQRYFYAIYCQIPVYNEDEARCGDGSFGANYFQNRAVAIFVGDASDTTTRVLLDRVSPDLSLNYYEPPQIVSTPAGKILYLPIAVDGTGHGNASEYYLRNGGHWRRIDSEAWLDGLRKYIPAGLDIRKGIWPDLKTMNAEAGLYQGGDANCCPTAGSLQIQFVIRSLRFEIESVSVRPPEPTP